MTQRSSSRAGTTLAELVVALTLLAVLTAIAALTSREALRREAATGADASRSEAIADGLRTITRHARDITPALGDLLAAADTALELRHPLGIGTICRMQRDTLVLAQAHDSTVWPASMPRAVSTGDEVRVWHEPAAAWVTRTVTATSAASTPCGDAIAPWPDRASTRVTLDDTMPFARPGTPVRILQRQRWSLLRSGSGDWSLAMATWDAPRNRFSTPQPLLAPLASPTAPGGPGFEVHALDALGATLPPGTLDSTRAITIVLRSEPRSARHRPILDSVQINVSH